MSRIIINFEIAIHFVIANVWSTIEIKGCRSQFDQGWWWKIQEIGLSAKYKDQSSEISKFLEYIFDLPFLYPDEVENVCNVSNNSEVLKFAT
jgi:hypothetical protein